MSLCTNEMTPADIFAVTCGGRNNNNDGGLFGGEGIVGLIALIIISGMFGFGGFGGFGGGAGGILPWLLFSGGYGGFGGGGAANNYALGTDVSMLSRQMSDGFNSQERKLDSVNNGLCDGFYTQANLINGVNMNIAQNGYESRLATQQLGSELASCCCDIREAISGVNYNNALANAGIQRQISDTGFGITTAVDKGFCQTNYNAANNTRDIIQSTHSDTDRIIARLDAMETNRLREQLDNERAANIALQGKIDRAQLRTEIVNDVRPCPIPSYQTCNPWAASYGLIGNGNSGCCGCSA